MKITDIHVGGFGVWNAMSVDGLSEQITLFYGPNEAGKTTLMQFVRAVLYGFSPERRKLYLPPVYGGEPGGILRMQNHSGEFVIERRNSETDPGGPGRVIVLAANGSRQGQHLLNVLISGIDEPIFNNVFAVGIRELQELATLNNTQAAEQLYNLASGVDRVSLVEVMRDLRSARTEIWDAEQDQGELNGLLARREKLLSEIAEFQGQTRRWVDLAAQRRGLVGEISQLDERIRQLQREARTVELALQVRDKWLQRAEVAREIAAVGSPEALPEAALQRLEDIKVRIADERARLEPHRKRRLEIRRELAAQPINQALWDQSCRIEAVCEHGPWIASLDHEIRTLEEDGESLELALLKHDESLRRAGGAAWAEAHAVTPRMLEQLQGPAQALREALHKRAIARKVQKRARQQAEEVADEIQDEIGGSLQDFDQSLEQAATLVKQLRRRIQNDEHLEQCRRQRSELGERYQELLDDQLQRVRILIAIGGMFVFGFVLALTGIFGWKIMPMSAEVGWGVSLLGFICLGLSVAWKVVVERTTQQELNDRLRRSDSLRDEIETLARQGEELERELPVGHGTLSTRLAAAEKELSRLEELAPRQLERQQAHKRKLESLRHRSGTEDGWREARARWRRGLRHFGLPESLTPKHVRQLAAHHQEKEKLESQRAQQQARLEKLRADRQTLAERLDQLTRDVGLNSLSHDPQIQLSQLATALAGQREMVGRRRQLQSEEKQMRGELARGLQNLRRLHRTCESLLAEARAADEAELRQRADTLQRLADLHERHQSLADQILAILGGASEEEIGNALRQYGLDELQTRWETLLTRLEDSQAHLGQLHQQHGEITQEMKSLAENRRPAAAKFELECVQTQLAQATARWRTLAVISNLLENIRETYEAERQPETLGEASLYLQRLTAGKYTRIWTPLGQNRLRVDDQQGTPLSLDVLSRGTREAVFLSLRLALVAAYGRRGVNVPMILDDVLVNLDARRAAAAVELLHDFARDGRQLLFFTCHEHVKAMFVAAGVDTRVLPKHGTPGVHVVPLLTQDPPREEVPQEEEAVAQQPPETASEEAAEPPADEIPEPEELTLRVEDEEFEIVYDDDEDQEEEPIASVEPLVPAEADLQYELEEPVEIVTPQIDLEQLLAAAEEAGQPPDESAADEQAEEVLEQVAELQTRHSTTSDDGQDQAADVDHVFDEASDEDAFDDGPWWWETTRRFGIEEEETAA